MFRGHFASVDPETESCAWLDSSVPSLNVRTIANGSNAQNHFFNFFFNSTLKFFSVLCFPGNLLSVSFDPAYDIALDRQRRQGNSKRSEFIGVYVRLPNN